ncbi:anthranilate synthase component II [Natranaerovirga pectinivora]|uniref:Anthranilate synthase component II n=1 Tax=Natranaerovirga pectinivora TaxID=682400 RepID=A0A4R3MQC4_9FIRM|nr:aminodeoxychorismate/anthranilate synthase component II [Natranaerovirga pectinivora]TCT17082.1 anthranilate synthase component II [Natranaerovirga pectinivora]
MILLIDNYDSFTYNLYQYLGKYTSDIKVVRNDKITIKEIRELNPDKIILSPGPKTPYEAGICMDVVTELSRDYPILGICLGHQSIAAAFGGTVSYAKALFHGKQSVITHDGEGIFKNLPNPLPVARYHSLSVIKENLPEELMAIAETDDGEIMAIKHRTYKTVGLQFHPESIYTEEGHQIIYNFLKGDI